MAVDSSSAQQDQHVSPEDAELQAALAMSMNEPQVQVSVKGGGCYLIIMTYPQSS